MTSKQDEETMEAYNDERKCPNPISTTQFQSTMKAWKIIHGTICMSFHFGFGKIWQAVHLDLPWKTAAPRHPYTSWLLNLLKIQCSYPVNSHYSSYQITNFRAVNTLITGTAPRVSFAGTLSRLAVRLSTIPHQSRPTKKTPSIPEKKGTMVPYYGITPYRSIGPTSLSSSQVYRVIISLATTTTPLRLSLIHIWRCRRRG